MKALLKGAQRTAASSAVCDNSINSSVALMIILFTSKGNLPLSHKISEINSSLEGFNKPCDRRVACTRMRRPRRSLRNGKNGNVARKGPFLQRHHL